MPDPITWYLLPRTATDIESIMEEIDAKLLTHNQDPSAHGQSGEVVETHRSDTELDHPFGSADLKHLTADKILMMTCFEAKDGWQSNGLFSVNLLQSFLYTTNVTDNYSACWFLNQDSPFLLEFSKSPFFQTTVAFSNNTNQLAYFGLGKFTDLPGEDGFGFKISNGTLYAVTYVGQVFHATEIAGITLTDSNVYRAYMDVSADKVYFYVNNVLCHTEETDVPFGTNVYYFTYYLQTKTTSVRTMWMYDLLYEQVR